MHTTKEGKTISISAMDDDHLYNTIVMHCREIDEQVTIATGEFDPDNEFDALFTQQADPQYVKQQARQRIQSTEIKLAAYVLEASIRNIDVSKPLQIAYRRSKKSRSSVRGSASFDRLLKSKED
jgi:hypothetical protein